ncbi:hypothetical protein CVS40_0665 [Lucilia cuprina]|nr:hypothetical protein CVS40_0665 [Lucilia cuprina]
MIYNTESVKWYPSGFENTLKLSSKVKMWFGITSIQFKILESRSSTGRSGVVRRKIDNKRFGNYLQFPQD